MFRCVTGMPNSLVKTRTSTFFPLLSHQSVSYPSLQFVLGVKAEAAAASVSCEKVITGGAFVRLTD